MIPTEQQKLIINYTKSAVIIAAPGSGKTFVVSEKIKNILGNLLEFQGVIAISYTNKASSELRERSLKNGISPKGSFFGTIDKFFISEIIIPFAKQLFGLPRNIVKVIRIESLKEDEQTQVSEVQRVGKLIDLDVDHIKLLKKYFLEGVLFIELVGIFANYIFTNSVACRKYILARYKYIFIDEYQDSGLNQHELFIKINALGITAIAVGDINQSIYAFSGKDSKFLNELISQKGFKLFKLDKNHRCHPSIINYSNYLLNSKTELIEVEEIRVGFFRIEGNEIETSKFIDLIIVDLKKKYAIEKNRDFAILTRNNRTANIVSENLQTPNKISVSSNLDLSLNVWSGIFSNLFNFAFNAKFRFIEVIEQITTYDKLNKEDRKELINLKKQIEDLFQAKPYDNKKIIQVFKNVAMIIAPNSQNEESVELLQEVLGSVLFLDSYKESADTEINIMTLHKSKGLEFEVVFHLDLHEWVLPFSSKGALKQANYNDWVQDLNLHYVGITRAKKYCILISSTKRTNSNMETKRGNDSEFLWDNDIKNLRQFNKSFDVNKATS
jgi:superfamily I DNA/RNA helicase